MEIWGGNRAFDSGVSTPGLDVWVYSRPYQGAASGGDIHYVSTCGGGKISRCVVADVAGHGEAVGKLGGQLRDLMRKHINKLDQTQFVQILSSELSALSKTGTFATALLASFFAPSGQLIICNAGHPRPLWYRAGQKTWHIVRHDIDAQLNKVMNLPLGIIPETDYHQFGLQLEPGDLILIYTDSVTEARSGEGQMLGEAGLLEMARKLNPSKPDRINHALRDAVAAYRNCEAAEDDLTLVTLHCNGDGARRPGVGETVKVLGKLMGLLKV